MADEIIVAIVAFGGVIISVFASLYSSMRQTNSELRKIRTELQQTYTNKLLDKRIEIYPDLYNLLSRFTKSIVTNQSISMGSLQELHENVSNWDVQNAVFLSGKAFELSYRFRVAIAELSKQSADEFNDSALLSDLRSKADSVKLALKEDLGIFVVEFPESEMAFHSFQDVANKTLNAK